MTSLNPYETSQVRAEPGLLISNWNRAGGVLVAGLLIGPAVFVGLIWLNANGTGGVDQRVEAAPWFVFPFAVAGIVYALRAPILWLELGPEYFRYRQPLRTVSMEWASVQRVTFLNDLRLQPLTQLYAAGQILLAVVIDDYREVHVQVPRDRYHEIVHLLGHVEAVLGRRLLDFGTEPTADDA